MNPVSPASHLAMNGILIVDKPNGWTSHDVCAFVRNRFKIPKVGHAGTLDPLATGVLVLLLGKATKRSMEMTACDKDYDGIMELGIKTDSHDRNGKVIGEKPFESVTFEAVCDKVREFTGEIIQTPPMVSALKYQGVRLYKLARQGREVPREGRKVFVHEFRIEKKEGPKVYFHACVSKGTYLRTLVNDLGEALGCFATLAELRRIRSGQFSLQESVTIETLKQITAEEFYQKIHPFRLISSYVHPLGA